MKVLRYTEPYYTDTGERLKAVYYLTKQEATYREGVKEMNIVRNCIMTPDGTVLQSHERHDYKQYTDANGEVYVVDGGCDYIRRSKNIEPFVDLTVYDTDEFKTVRKVLEWGVINKDITSNPYTFVSISELSNGHIEAILLTQTHIPKWRRDLFVLELDYRKDNKIFVEEHDYAEDTSPVTAD